MSTKKYRQENAEKIAAYNAAYRLKNAEKIRAYNKSRLPLVREAVDRYQAANPEKVKKCRDDWRAKNPNYARNYCIANKERLSEKRKERDKANPEKARAKVRNRRARIRRAKGSHTAEDIQEIFKRQRGRCAHSWCRAKLEKYHVDHRQPLARGGSNSKENLQLLCGPCNQQKHVKDPMEWNRQHGLLL